MKNVDPHKLQGWAAIAKFLGQPLGVAQKWAKDGMPVRREGRYVTASAEELGAWLGRESHAGGPVLVATNAADLTADLKRGLTTARRRRRAS